jgi:hypothetical protein
MGTKIGVVVLAGLGVLALYLWGTPGLYAAVVLIVLVAFVVGVATRSVKRVVRATRSREEVGRRAGTVPTRVREPADDRALTRTGHLDGDSPGRGIRVAVGSA